MYLVSRKETFVKLFFLVSFTGLFMYLVLAFYSCYILYSPETEISEEYPDYLSGNILTDADQMTNVKYILLWTANTYLQDEGKTAFLKDRCPNLNCYLTTNKSLIKGDYTNFDAIIFNLSMLSRMPLRLLPKRRQLRQKYVFYSMMPSADYPVCNVIFDNYFNWTWTYKFDSDIFSPFIETSNRKGEVVAPRSDINYIMPDKANSDVSQFNTNILKKKANKKAVTLVMDHCDNNNTRKINNFARKLKKALQEHSLVFDIFGCDYEECPSNGCLEIIREDYYFYLVYEDSMSKDYVTDEVLKAYDQNVVPIVYGRADYTKFLPMRSYINANYYTIKNLANSIAYILRSSARYQEYFQWKSQYNVHRAYDKGLCKLCAFLNDKQKFETFSSYENFRKWWYLGSLKEKCQNRRGKAEILSY